MTRFQERITRLIARAPRGLTCEGVAVAVFGRGCTRGQRNRTDEALHSLIDAGAVRPSSPDGTAARWTVTR